MTAPTQARETDNGRYYTDPSPAFDGALYPSVTNVLSVGVNKPALVPWATKITAEYAFDHLLDLMAEAVVDRPTALKRLKAQVRAVKDDAADLGSRVHAAAERHNLGLPMDAEPDVEAFTRQYLAWLESWGVDLEADMEASEASVVHRGIGYAGTFDLLVWLRSGIERARELWLIDFKTSSKRPVTSIYEEHVLQLAALRHAKTVWLPGGGEARMPMADRCAVLNLRRGTHALLEVPADRDAFVAFQGALATTRFIHGIDLKSAVRQVEAPKPVAVEGAV